METARDLNPKYQTESANRDFDYNDVYKTNRILMTKFEISSNIGGTERMRVVPTLKLLDSTIKEACIFVVAVFAVIKIINSGMKKSRFSNCR